MPYTIKKAPLKELYYVVAEDGRKMSKSPMPLERAKRQLRALYMNVKDMK